MSTIYSLSSALLSKFQMNPRRKLLMKECQLPLLEAQIHIKTNLSIIFPSKDKNPIKSIMFGRKITMTQWCKSLTRSPERTQLIVRKYIRKSKSIKEKERENLTTSKRTKLKTSLKILVKPSSPSFKNTKKLSKLSWKNIKLELQNNLLNTWNSRKRK